ncbi:MAG: tRNA pseudouridine(38-40) synthase TruA [Anaerolineales bacterium]|nr:tRNA pseudouridine(38-40) synthase TruA [Anaerolineales bacterium]
MRSSPVTYQSIVAYDGTCFEGFQRQAEGHRTVQGALEMALRKIGWQGRALKAAGRTDAGVHASGQVIGFDLVWDHTMDDLTAAMNANLPMDVAVRTSKPAWEGFHPRFDALSRSYRYRIVIDPVRDPLSERYAWRLSSAPDLERLNAAARIFEGEQDFAAFGRPPGERSSTIRNVFACRWVHDRERFDLHIEANAFLYHMVRHVVVAIVDVGLGEENLAHVQALLDDPSRRRQGRLAPAAGLCLMHVKYADQDQTRPGELQLN